MTPWLDLKIQGLDPGGTAHRLLRFCRHVVTRFGEDGCFAAAGALSYTTLVSMVPLLAISLAVLSAFPIFDQLRAQLLDLIFSSFVPKIGGTVERYISDFATSAGKTTAFGIGALAVTAIMLLATVEDRLDGIWRVERQRGWIARITVYWTVLTLGPLLFGVALSVSTTLHRLATEYVMVPDQGSFWLSGPAMLVPGLLEALGLTLCYCLIPHCPVRWRDGLIGAAIGAALLELGKGGFIIFLDRFSSYETVYGALAAIPTFLLWMYMSWSVVLFGAEITAAVPFWGAQDDIALSPDLADLELALAIVEGLEAQRRIGGPAHLRPLALRLGMPVVRIADCLHRLVRGGFVAETGPTQWVLSRDLASATLFDLQAALGKAKPDRTPSHPGLAHRLDAVRAAEAEALAVPLANLLSDKSGA